RHFQELIRRQRTRSKPCLPHCAVEVVHVIHSRADRRPTRALGFECNLAFTLKLAIHVAPEDLSIVRGGDVIPLANRMQLVAKQYRSVVTRTGYERVETPLIAVDDAQLEQETGV